MSMWGGATTGMTGMSGTTEAVSATGSSIQPQAGEAAKGFDWKKFGKDAGEQMGKGGGGGKGAHSLPSQRPIGEHPETPERELDDSPARQGFARLAEVPERQRTYGTP